MHLACLNLARLAAATTSAPLLVLAGAGSGRTETLIRGLHGVTPLCPKADWSNAKAFCRALREVVAADARNRFTTAFSKLDPKRFTMTSAPKVLRRQDLWADLQQAAVPLPKLR